MISCFQLCYQLCNLKALHRGTVIQFIREICQAKMILEAEENNTELLPEFLYGFMLRRYGLVKLAEMHTVEFLASCSKYKFESSRVLMFCRFLALKGSDALSAAAFEFTLRVNRMVNRQPQAGRGGPFH